MKNSFFKFRQFTIHHDRCAMKVGTDGVLLGAWGCVEGKRILDIGTGTGLIALMAAQRNPGAEVMGIDVDESAVLQAKENIAGSPFKSRVECVLQDVLTFEPEKPFDAILCNPPFFTEDTQPDDKSRALARNNKSLPFPQLIKKVASLLADEGTFSVIIPFDLAKEIVSLCLNENMHLVSRCIVRTKANKPPRRALLEFSDLRALKARLGAEASKNRLKTTDNRIDDLCLLAEDGNRSEAYQALTKDFYL